MLQRMTRRIRRRANLVLAALTCVAFLGGAAQRGLFAQTCFNGDPSFSACEPNWTCTAGSTAPTGGCNPIDLTNPGCGPLGFATYACTSASCSDTVTTSVYAVYINCVPV